MSDLPDDIEPDENDHSEPDESITRELFLNWRSPRMGKANPEPMDNAVWDWLIRSRLNGFMANDHFSGPSSMRVGPCWSFDRFGQSSTKLADGRMVMIAGEHEDFYDPDFYIYNDVVVRNPNGQIHIFGYPKESFPPTDFHTATLVGDKIIIIGNLGYVGERKPGITPVFELSLRDFKIKGVATKGKGPGWIHEHTATWNETLNAIVVNEGYLVQGDKNQPFDKNDSEWRLDLKSWRWEETK